MIYDAELCVMWFQNKTKIQRDDKVKAVYSSGNYSPKYLTENRNLDICVADSDAGAVVVVSVASKLRFRYTGSPASILIFMIFLKI